MRAVIVAALALAAGAAGCGGTPPPPTRQLEPGRGIATPDGGRVPIGNPPATDRGGK